jgi:hypothetical protein
MSLGPPLDSGARLSLFAQYLGVNLRRFSEAIGRKASKTERGVVSQAGLSGYVLAASLTKAPAVPQGTMSGRQLEKAAAHRRSTAAFWVGWRRSMGPTQTAAGIPSSPPSP